MKEFSCGAVVPGCDAHFHGDTIEEILTQVSIHAAPARAEDLSGLPPTYIDCASAETFRDEDVAYANRIWQAGGVCDLHVWAGAFHGCEGMVPDAAISVGMRQTRIHFLERVLRTA